MIRKCSNRNYSPTRHCVCFWGHDSAFEVSFHLDEEVPYANRNEASLLHVFDVNRARIQETASVAYSRSRGPHSYHRLSASDLLQPSIVEEAIAQGDRHGNRDAKKPKKLKPKEMVPVSTLA